MPEVAKPDADNPTPPGNGAAENQNEMSAETKQIIEKIDEVKTDITQVTDVLKEAVVQVATGAQGVDENAIKKLFGDETEPGKGEGKVTKKKEEGATGAADHPTGHIPEEKKDNPPTGASGNSQQQMLESIKEMQKELKSTKDELTTIRQSSIDAKLIAANNVRAEQALLIVRGKIAREEIKTEDAEKVHKEIMEWKDSRDDTKLADLKIISEMYGALPEIEMVPTGAAGDDYFISGTPKGNLKNFMDEME